MMKWSSGGVGIILALLMLLILRYGLLNNSLMQRSLQYSFSYNSSDRLNWKYDGSLLEPQFRGNGSQVISVGSFFSGLFRFKNFSKEEIYSLQTWRRMNHLLSNSQELPQALDSIKEAQIALGNLLGSIEEEKRLHSGNETAYREAKAKQCPYSIKRMNMSEFNRAWFRLKIPCGMIQGSSLTVIGTPGGLLGEFQIDMVAPALPGEPEPSIILHYNVRLSGDKVTEDPVIVQNTWTISNDWGEEERCPSPDPEINEKVDGLKQCSEMVGKYDKRVFYSKNYSKKNEAVRQYFPFKQGYLAIATLRVGLEGIQMTVDGKHITSFTYRESLEPWLVSEVRISGDIKLISVLSSGLPTSEDLNHIVDLETLRSTPLPLHKSLDLFVGVFSTANNFKRRMAVRRTWLQYEAVRSGTAAVRFFVGLHKNQIVNEELWKEAQTYGDVQLMPFVDYYSMITWKTIAICIYGTNVVSAKYVMKTDDDSFVRVDEVLNSLQNTNITRGLLYGLINTDAQPHRDPYSKWFISPMEWSDDTYPPWAHGPGYVVSHDIAKTIYKQHKKGHLRMFKLEDVAMGIWISDMKKEGMVVNYVNEGRIYTEGCQPGYVVAHYQAPRNMLCLWQRLQEMKRPTCCQE